MFKIILIDFSWIYNKYYYVAKSKPLRTLKELESKEHLIPTIRDMFLRFFGLIERSYPSAHIFLVLDPPLSSTENYALCEDYKQNRNKEEKKRVYENFKEIVGELSLKLSKKFTFIRAIGYEADQVIASLAETNRDKKVLIFSGDKDLLQLSYYENVSISEKYEKGAFLLKTDKEIFGKFKNSKGEDFTRISTNKKDILKYRVLKGDTSDNLGPVFPRIKDTEIKSLIRDYWIDDMSEGLTEARLNDILDDLKGDNRELAKKLEENKGNWLRNYKMMNLYGFKDLPIKKVVKHA